MTIAQQLKIKDFPFEIRDRNGKEIYVENSDGSWQKREYDANGNKIFYEDSNGVWAARKYDANGNQIYFKNSVGFWEKREWDASGNQRYYENSHEFWAKYEYDADGNEIYYENSDGKIFDNRPESEIKKAIKILTKENLLEWVNHVADTSKMIDMQDAIADAYRKHVGRCGLQTYAQTYRHGWQDALAWKGGQP